MEVKIRIWDDVEQAASDWKSKLEKALGNEVTVHANKADEIAAQLEVLHERRQDYTTGKDAESRDDCELDDVDVLIVDNDLFELPQHNDLSAETVASRVSVYTNCASIVVLNLSPDIDFDLRLLGHPESKADLHINDRFVSDLGLWRTCPKDDGAFRPWDWPLLSRARAFYQARVDEVVALLRSDESEMPILEFLGFKQSARRRLSRSARAFLHPEKQAETVSFWDFVDGNMMAVGRLDGEQITERRDSAMVARIGARRISTWLLRYVLGPQDVLVDFPHVVERMPFVIPWEKREAKEFWNTTAKLIDAPIKLIEEHGVSPLQKKSWLDRPAFWADELESEENVGKLLEESEANPRGLVFCEDASSFFPAQECDQFVAAYNSMADRRFVRWLESKGDSNRYGPQSRLAR